MNKMKGMYVHSRIGEMDSLIVDALKEEHEVLPHIGLWTAAEAISDEGGVEFIVTNMPYEGISLARMKIYSHLPPEEYYELLYASSFESLDRIHKSHPGIKVVAYTGADEGACVIAVARHNVDHLIRKGRHEAKYEIDEMMKAIRGDKYSPLWLKLGHARAMRLVLKDDADGR
jgi:hypothetical protein